MIERLHALWASVSSDLPAWWMNLAAGTQDALLFGALLLPALLFGLILTAGFRPFGLVGAMLWRFRWTNILFVVLIAASIGIGVGLIAQERGLRQGTARAADKFDLVIAAPGSEITAMLAAVYLQPSDMPLLGGDIYAEVSGDPRVSIAAPIAFGDSFGGAPVVGTTPDFVTHLSGGLADGAMFADMHDAVAGAFAPVSIGAVFSPAHGMRAAAGEDHDDDHGDAHEGVSYTVVGRMAPTGSPWDKAILVPVEAVWDVHGLAPGHGPGWDGTVGPPFDPAYFAGTPAIMVRAEALWANYALRSDFSRDDAMAFFPGAVLSQLHGLLGDVRQAMSILAVVTEILVTAGVLAGLVVLARLYAQRLALLRALGAPARFVFALIWCYAAALIVSGAGLGLALGYGASAVLSRIVTARTDILVSASLGWPEAHLVAAFVSLTVLLAMLPAFAAMRRAVVPDLRA